MNYKVLVTDEAINDMVGFIRYIRDELCNQEAAHKLLDGFEREIMDMSKFPLKGTYAGIEYRNYTIHKIVYQSYLLFYISNDKDKTISILRVLKDVMNWPGILRETKIYHFSNYKNRYDNNS